MAGDWEDKLLALPGLTDDEKLQLSILLADKQEHARLALVTPPPSGDSAWVVKKLRFMLAGVAGGSSMECMTPSSMRVVGREGAWGHAAMGGGDA